MSKPDEKLKLYQSVIPPDDLIKDFKRSLPAEENVGREIRRALQALPAEARPEIEKILREHGALPKGALPLEFHEEPLKP